MKKPIVFDNDCLASFIWVRRLDILVDLIGDDIIIPEAVVSEISKMKSYPNFSFVYTDLVSKIDEGQIKLMPILVSSPEGEEYLSLISMKNPKRIGRGEASAIVLAKSLNGTVASNNLADILPHVVGGVPPYICTDELLYLSLKKGYISILDGESIWYEMKIKKRKLPNYSFSQAVRKFEKRRLKNDKV